MGMTWNEKNIGVLSGLSSYIVAEASRIWPILAPTNLNIFCVIFLYHIPAQKLCYARGDYHQGLHPERMHS
jgi:hypothetical protein